MQTPLSQTQPEAVTDDLVVVTEPETTQFNLQARTGNVVVHSQDREKLNSPQTIDRVLAYAASQGLKEPGISSRQAPYPYIGADGKMNGFRNDFRVMGK